MSALIGVDVGGTKIAVAVVRDGQITHKTVEPTPRQGWRSVLEQIATQVQDLRQHVPDIAAVGVGVPGPLDFKAGKVIFAPNIYDFRDVPIRDYLSDKLGVHVEIENDANAAALGEAMYGAAKGAASCVFLTISTGIGGGIVLDGKVIRGANGIAGEVGHVRAVAGGTVAGSGVVGALEAIASGTAIARDASYALGRAVSTQEAFELAQQGNTIARAIVENAMYHLGIHIADTQLFFDPEVFVLGGGVSMVGDYFMNHVRSVAEQQLQAFTQPRIVQAILGSDAGIIGAALASQV